MPNSHYRNAHQTEAGSVHDYGDRNMPKIINCTTVAPRNQQRRYMMANGSENSTHQEPSGFLTPTYELSQLDGDVISEAQTNSRLQQQRMRHSGYVVSSASPVIQEVFSRPPSSRSNDINARNLNHGNRTSEPGYQRGSPNSAFVPFGTHMNQQARHHYPSYQEMRNVRSNQQSSQQSAKSSNQTRDPSAARSRFNCPVPIPNKGTVVMNPNQPVMLPPYGSHDGLAGILVIPLKKTCEIAVQTDESCLSKEYTEYRPPKSHVHDDAQSNSHGDTNSLLCTVCQKEFQDAQTLRQHYDACHSKDSLRCKDCGQVFLTARNMQMHKVRVHNKRMPFRCGVCGVRFEDRASVVQHLSTHNANEYIFRCDTCGKRFGNEEKLRKHEQKHQDMWHKCLQCKKTFGSEVTLAYHIEQVHKRHHERRESEGEQQGEAQGQTELTEAGNQDVSGEREATKEISSTGEDMACAFCNLLFRSNKDLEEHVKDCGLGKGMKKMFRCAVCQTFFALKSQLVNHYNTMHLTRDGYLCSKCPRKFRLWSRLKMHIKAFHHTKKSVVTKNVCSVCAEKFMSRNKLEEHLRQVHQIQPFQSKVGRIYTCKECKKRFTNLSSLMVHRRGVHSLNILESPSTQTWKCQYCNIERLTKKTYIAHLKEVHNLSVLEKGRSLEIVGKEGEASSLSQENGIGFKSPVLTHEKPEFGKEEKDENESLSKELSCSECGANFADQKRLKNHLGLFHGQKPFSCDTCGKRFAYSGQVAWHMREHKTEKNPVEDDSESVNSVPKKGNDIIVTSEGNGVISVGQALPPHTCVHCNTTYQNEKRLNNHLGMRHGYKNFKCDVCSQRFSYSTHLIWHRRSHFPDKKKDNNGTKISGEENSNSDHAFDESIGEENIEGHQSLGEKKDGSEGIHGQADELEQGNDVPCRQSNSFVCGQCGAVFNEQEEFKNHMVGVHNVNAERVGEEDASALGELPEAGSYMCEICNKQLSTQIGWKVHRTRVHKLSDEKVVKSPTNSLQELFQYTNDNGEDANEVMNEGQSPVSRRNDLGSEDISPNAVYSCSKCSRVFNGLRSLRTHQFKLHAIRVKDNVQQQSPQMSNDATFFSRVQNGDIFQCGTCDYQFSSEKGRRIHCKKMRHAEKRASFSEPVSDVARSMDGGLVIDTDEMENSSESKRQKLSDDFLDMDSDDVSLCEVCGAEFLGLRALRLHFQERHPEELSFQEPNSKSSDERLLGADASSDALQPSPLLIECPRCERSFTSRKAINAHMVKYHKLKGAALVRTLKEGRTETKESTHAEVCDNQDLSLASSDSAALTSSDTSAGESKRFKVCPVCQRAFHNRRGLTMHLVRYHHMNKIGIQKFNLGAQIDGDLSATNLTSKKPATSAGLSTSLKERCPLCPMNFPSKRSLGTHIFKRHGIRCKQLAPAERRSLFSGTIFPRTEGELKTSNREILIATDCPICGGKFVGKRGLRAHVSRIHGLDKVELGFMFPDKNAADDGTFTKCSDCERVFNNKRIFAAHLYFVHKKDNDDMNVTNSGLDPGNENLKGFMDTAMEEQSAVNGNMAENGGYFCTDSSCDQVFKTPLELLVHVRQKNGRSIIDVDKELKNVNNIAAAEEHDDSFDYDYADYDEVDVEDEILDGERAIDGGKLIG